MTEDNLTKLRNEIDNLDSQLLTLIRKRLNIVAQIKHLKEDGYYVGRPIRERDLLQKWVDTAPDIPKETLKTIARIFITTALKMEADDLHVCGTEGLEDIIYQNYLLANPTFHKNPDTLFAVQAQTPLNSITFLPLDDMRYWQAPYIDEIGKNNFYIFEMVPVMQDKKRAVKLAILPMKHLPKNPLYLSTDIDYDADDDALCKHFDATQTIKAGFKIYTRSAIGNADLARRFIGGYSNSIKFDLES